MKIAIRALIVIWLVLWVVFLARADKDGQYKEIMALYKTPGADKMRFITGNDLYDFLSFSKTYIPDKATYTIEGFERFSIDAVRARYILYPARNVPEDGDFKLVYGKIPAGHAGYEIYKTYEDNGAILKKTSL